MSASVHGKNSREKAENLCEKEEKDDIRISFSFCFSLIFFLFSFLTRNENGASAILLRLLICWYVGDATAASFFGCPTIEVPTEEKGSRLVSLSFSSLLVGRGERYLTASPSDLNKNVREARNFPLFMMVADVLCACRLLMNR